MKYIDEFRNQKLIKKISRKISAIAPSWPIKIMEVCGTHTQSFLRFGLDKLLPSQVKLIAGPGCPVCVSTQDYIDRAITYAKQKNCLILTFGDMLRVPGSRSSLEKERAKGADIRIIYSPWDTLKFAKAYPDKKIIFLAVGFETTAPAIALSILEAQKENLKNLFFFSALKLIPAAMRYLLKDKRLNLSAFLCPGHVSVIIGTKPYAFIPKEYKIGCCVAGFEPLDILEGMYLLLKQIRNKRPGVANQYIRLVRPQGNPEAQKMIARVFKTRDVFWRGLGEIPESGLEIRHEFAQFDIEKFFPLGNKQQASSDKQKGCCCGDVLKGIITPAECPRFKKGCSPQMPLGPCMVSQEGACNAYYRYQ